MKLQNLDIPIPATCPRCMVHFTADCLLWGIHPDDPEEPHSLALCDSCLEDFDGLSEEDQQSEFETLVEWDP